MGQISHLKWNFYEFPAEKTQIFPGVAFLSRVLHDCLSKCPNSKKPPLPWKITGYEPEESLKFKV